MLNNPFSRFNQSIVDYPTLHDDVDDIPMYQVDNFERQKHYNPKKKNVVGMSTPVPLDDNDETLTFFDIQGESLYTNPPASQNPTIDHGLDEDEIWAFRLTNYNQVAVTNSYMRGLYRTTRVNHAPFWGKKLMAPAWYKEEKMGKFFEQWNTRIGLEGVKMRHMLEEYTSADKDCPKRLAS
jgi:hypothetical protein